MAEITIEQLQATVEAQGKTIEAQGKLIDALKKQVNAKTDVSVNEKEKLPEIPKEPVKVGDKTYVWKVAQFRIPGVDGPVKATEAALDNDLIAAILKVKGQSILVEQV